MNAIFCLTPKSSCMYLYGDQPLKQVMERIRSKGFAAVPVINRDGEYLGSISEGDLLWFLCDLEKSGSGDPFKASEKVLLKDVISNKKYIASHVDIPFDELVERAINQNFVPLIDDRGIFIGIVTRSKMIEWMKRNQK